MTRYVTRLSVQILMLAILLWALPATASAQGVLIVVDPNVQVRLPRPHHFRRPHPMSVPPSASYKIKELDIQARLVDQVARVQVSQTFENTGSRQMEVSFVFPLPYDGAVDQLTLMVDGKEFPAKLLDAKEARRLYEAIVRKNRVLPASVHESSARICYRWPRGRDSLEDS
ncbi:MAG: hypothetical protein JW888_18070, partial [Pirellulales bacterium]|nr:hypothetical protein [Pirellulales bacterium]